LIIYRSFIRELVPVFQISEEQVEEIAGNFQENEERAIL